VIVLSNSLCAVYQSPPAWGQGMGRIFCLSDPEPQVFSKSPIGIENRFFYFTWVFSTKKIVKTATIAELDLLGGSLFSKDCNGFVISCLQLLPNKFTRVISHLHHTPRYFYDSHDAQIFLRM